jgi:hypothetical protein
VALCVLYLVTPIFAAKIPTSLRSSSLEELRFRAVLVASLEFVRAWGAGAFLLALAAEYLSPPGFLAPS